MAATAAHTIRIQDFSNIRREAVGLGTITPGHLLAINNTGKVIPHNVAAGDQRAMFAVEDDLQGKDINDNYASGDMVSYHIFRRGDRVNAILASGQNIAIGDKLESAGNGKLRKYELSSGEVPNPLAIVGFATVALNLTVSGATDTHTVIEIV